MLRLRLLFWWVRYGYFILPIFFSFKSLWIEEQINVVVNWLKLALVSLSWICRIHVLLRGKDSWLFILAPFNFVFLLSTRLSFFITLDVVTCGSSYLDLRITRRSLFLLFHNGWLWHVRCICPWKILVRAIDLISCQLSIHAGNHVRREHDIGWLLTEWLWIATWLRWILVRGSIINFEVL